MSPAGISAGVGNLVAQWERWNCLDAAGCRAPPFLGVGCQLPQMPHSVSWYSDDLRVHTMNWRQKPLKILKPEFVSNCKKAHALPRETVERGRRKRPRTTAFVYCFSALSGLGCTHIPCRSPACLAGLSSCWARIGSAVSHVECGPLNCWAVGCGASPKPKHFLVWSAWFRKLDWFFFSFLFQFN